METAPVFATDPVCGMAVEIKPGAISARWGSSSYYFCSEECRDRFLAMARA
jgi:YHS domain-containing protein